MHALITNSAPLLLLAMVIKACKNASRSLSGHQ